MADAEQTDEQKRYHTPVAEHSNLEKTAEKAPEPKSEPKANRSTEGSFERTTSEEK